VARGTARLRFSLMPTHEDRYLEQALEAVPAAVRSLGLTR
jgi:7-keto-8-aminopelargonate synthetase-like enzyme